MSFKSGFLKFAWGPREASKVLSLAKKRQLPKASKRLLGLGSGLRNIRPVTDPEVRYFMSQVIENLSPEHQGELRLALQVKKHSIIPGRQSVQKELKSHGLDAKNTKMLHAIAKGHELDEGIVRKSPVAHFGHHSPDVLFREHNRVRALGPEYQRVKDTFKNLRKDKETAWFPKQIPYGEGQRLSRHARRRLTEALEKRQQDYVEKIKDKIKNETL